MTGDGIQLLQLYREQGGLQFVQSRIIPDQLIMLFYHIGGYKVIDKYLKRRKGRAHEAIDALMAACS
jgi:hypothetical protein